MAHTPSETGVQRRPRTAPYKRSKADTSVKRKNIDWEVVPAVYYRIGIQLRFERDNPDLAIAANFPPYTAMEPFLETMRQLHPDLYAQMQVTNTGQPRSHRDQLKVLYNRGHKAWYANGKDRASGERLCQSSEHYCQSMALKPHVEKAKQVLSKPIRGGTPRTPRV
jgi:hypothetical protein